MVVGAQVAPSKPAAHARPARERRDSTAIGTANTAVPRSVLDTSSLVALACVVHALGAADVLLVLRQALRQPLIPAALVPLATLAALLPLATRPA